MYVQEQFRINYGFWDGAADVLNAIFSYASLASFVGALATSGHSTIWQPTTALPVTTIVQPQTLAEPKSTKFCRFCGAKIPRVSKYCEECGKNLG